VIAGYKYKALLSAVMGQIGTVLGYSAPFIGAFSDRLPDKYTRWLGGRRRPFVLIGGISGSFSLWMTYVAVVGSYENGSMDTLHFVYLFAANFIGCVGGSLAGPPSSALIPETIPAKQRGTMVAITSWFDTIINIGGNVIGYMVGENLILGEQSVWWINIIANPLMLPLVLVTFNGSACTGWSFHGIWKPEKAKSKKVIEDHERIALNNQLRADKVKMDKKKFGCAYYARSVWSELKYFTTAFSDTCYRLLWLQGLVGTIGGIIMWQFGFYWYQDCFPHGYYFFKWKVATTPMSAISIQGIISQALYVFMVPAFRPDYWRDRVGARPLMLWINLLGVPLIGPYVYWYWNGTANMCARAPFLFLFVLPSLVSLLPADAAAPGRYTILLLWNVWGSIIGPVTTSAGGAFMMDCLPADDRGQPLSAARDLNFHNWAWRLPETGFPLLTAWWMTTFPNHIDYFNVVFLIGGTIGNISWIMFITLVHPRDEKLDCDFQVQTRT
jgi:Na+/melibiose symporter-like transporter